MKELRTDFALWYTSLKGRGRIIFYLACAALAWLITRLILVIARIDLLPLPLDIILATVCIFLITAICTQFYVVRRMLKTTRKIQSDLAVRGRRGGHAMENVGGTRNAGSLRRRGGGGNQMQAVSSLSLLSQEILDSQFRPQPFTKPTLVSDWMEIDGKGIYALSSSPKAKVEIVDASMLGSGYYVGKYAPTGILKERTFITHRTTGEPLSFNSIRNAKKAIGGNPNKRKTNKSKKKRK